uniref:TBC1 domain family, member 17 n=1 Tax=Pundamilia nyererei TaxID=303518 RepID=A0A3B4GG31_9CICH
MKVQWKSVSEEQEMRNSLLRGYRSLIERDVNRTDRHNTFFSGNDNPGLTLLHDVLMTYCMYNFDLGYVQGMSDLLSPILFVTQNEVESFWCLTGFMELVVSKNICSLFCYRLSPFLACPSDSQDSGSLCFCFRWLLIWFKREFSFEDILTLWEVLWTRLPCENFHLLIACSILESQREELIVSMNTSTSECSFYFYFS